MFRNEVRIRVEKEHLGLCLRSRDSAGEAELSIVCLAPVDTGAVTIVRCLTKRRARRGQRQKASAYKGEKMLELAKEQLMGNVSVCAALQEK